MAATHVGDSRRPGYVSTVGPLAVALDTAQAIVDVRAMVVDRIQQLQRAGARPPDRYITLLASLDRARANWSAVLGASAEAIGNAETPAAGERPSSTAIDVAEASRLLELGERQTRNLASELGAEKVRGTWRFDRLAVLNEATRRKEMAWS